ncbi:MAG: DUF4198 domain-containing protein [Gammaproteobacteria bacterium]|nr:DUF4198 domain-containing protein [Gammaproteobacteria bacterium]
MTNRGRNGLAVAYRSHGYFVELKPDTFRSYLKEEGLDYILPDLDVRGLSDIDAREFFVRCAKTLIRDENGMAPAVFDHRFGLPLEIAPLKDPYGPDNDPELPVEVLFQGQPVDGIKVFAIRQGISRPPSPVTTRDGKAVVLLDGPGKWLIKAVHMVEYPRAGAEWVSYWASLTLER